MDNNINIIPINKVKKIIKEDEVRKEEKITELTFDDDDDDDESDDDGFINYN
jgi:hypothetical protein